MRGSVYYKSYVLGVPTPFYTVHARLTLSLRTCLVPSHGNNF